MLSWHLMRSGAAALLLVLAASGAAHKERLKITGKVTFQGHRVPSGRKVRAVLSRDFPGAGVPEDALDKKVDGNRFSFDKLDAGSYWLCAYLDDDGDHKLNPGQDIMGYATINPVPIGEGRSAFATVVDLDPTMITLVTRFEPANGPAPARRVLESLRVVPLHPRTGKFLEDAEVTVGSQKLELAPGEAAFQWLPNPVPDAQPRYVIEVAHPAYGRRPSRHVVAPRAFGAVPDARLDGKRVEWTSPAWANYAHVLATLPGGKVVLDRVAHSPLEIADLGPGASVRVRVGRVDIQHGGVLTLSVGDVVLKMPWTAAPGAAPGKAAPAPPPTPPAPAPPPPSAGPPKPTLTPK